MTTFWQVREGSLEGSENQVWTRLWARCGSDWMNDRWWKCWIISKGSLSCTSDACFHTVGLHVSCIWYPAPWAMHDAARRRAGCAVLWKKTVRIKMWQYWPVRGRSLETNQRKKTGRTLTESYYRQRSRGDNTFGSVRPSICLWALFCLSRLTFDLAFGLRVDLGL